LDDRQKKKLKMPKRKQRSRRGAVSAKGERALKDREAKAIEGHKITIVIRGARTSQTLKSVLDDLYQLRRPDAIKYQRNNDLLPFEDVSSLEYFAQRSDATLFAFGNHNKKRPDNLILGRFFDGKLLDMIELGVHNYLPMTSFSTEKPFLGHRPALLFRGDAFSGANASMSIVQNLLLDFFRGHQVDVVNLQGLNNVIVITAVTHSSPSSSAASSSSSSASMFSDPLVANTVLHFRLYNVLLKKSGTKLPRVELDECGPRMDWQMRRVQLAPKDVRKIAMRQAAQLRVKKKKNIETNDLRDTLGRIHMHPQSFEGFQVRKVPALKKSSDKKLEAREAREAEGKPNRRKKRRRGGGAAPRDNHRPQFDPTTSQ
jgi:ribosome production factor 2